MFNINSQAKKKSHHYEKDKKDTYMSFSELTFLKPHGEKRWTREEQEKRNAPLRKKGESSTSMLPPSIGQKISKENKANLKKDDKKPQQNQGQVGKWVEFNPVARNIIIDDSLDFECITFSLSPRQCQSEKAETPESTSSSSYSSDNDSQLSESSSSDDSADEASLTFKKQPY
jgi:hypothetical protein